MPTSHHHVHHIHTHIAKHVILPLAKKELLSVCMKGAGIHKKRSMKFTSVQAGRLARLAKKQMKGRGFLDRLKKIGSSVLSKFTDVGNLKKYISIS